MFLDSNRLENSFFPHIGDLASVNVDSAPKSLVFVSGSQSYESFEACPDQDANGLWVLCVFDEDHFVVAYFSFFNEPCESQVGTPNVLQVSDYSRASCP